MYRFNADVSAFLGLPITEYSSKKTMWGLVKSNNKTPSLWMPFCTRILKLEMADKFLEQLPYFAYHQDNPNANELALYPDVDYVLYTGFCAGENLRVDRALSITRNKLHPVYHSSAIILQANNSRRMGHKTTPCLSMVRA